MLCVALIKGPQPKLAYRPDCHGMPSIRSYSRNHFECAREYCSFGDMLLGIHTGRKAPIGILDANVGTHFQRVSSHELCTKRFSRKQLQAGIAK